MNTGPKCVCCIAVLSLFAHAFGIAASEIQMPLTVAPWPAQDNLDRALPTTAEVGPPRSNRFVGIFYFLWHNRTDIHNSPSGGPYDVRKILQRDPLALDKPDSRIWGPVGAPHYWGEPLYGYYRSDDPWILRRHAHALADAGIDVLVFDTTNARSYSQVYLALCKVFRKIRQEGDETPQIAFMVNSKAGETAQQIYEELYRSGKYKELWFFWHDKPLLICDPTKVSAELREFFTLRRAHWPFKMENTSGAWHWEATYQQPFGYLDNPDVPEQVSVSVAQNLRRVDGRVTNMSDGDARGRSFHLGQIDNSPGAIDHGHNFQEQWKRAFSLDPPFVLITGWNEWTAQRFKRTKKPIVFVDQYDQEFSRDIEFAKHGHLDNYYYQMVANIRRYKGMPKLPQYQASHSIDLEMGFQQWQDVPGEFTDHLGETIPRDHQGIGGTHYRNDSGRNDIIACKAASDSHFVYFYLRSSSELQPSSSPRNLWLLIDTDQVRSTGWEGYDLIVGREFDQEGHMWLEKHVAEWNWERIVPVQFRQVGNELHLAVPRTAFTKQEGSLIRFDFKWADNMQRPGDIQEFHLNGDVAPDGRFNYRYQAK